MQYFVIGTADRGKVVIICTRITLGKLYKEKHAFTDISQKVAKIAFKMSTESKKSKLVMALQVKRQNLSIGYSIRSMIVKV